MSKKERLALISEIMKLQKKGSIKDNKHGDVFDVLYAEEEDVLNEIFKQLKEMKDV